MKPNQLTHQIIGAAIEVHRELGPGKAEAAYESALSHELTLRSLPHCVQKPVPVVYKGIKLDCGYRLDVLVDRTVVLEVKSAEVVIPVHRAQVLTCLKIGGWKLALLLNFNVATLKEGIERIVLGFEDDAGAVPGERKTLQRTTLAVTAPFLRSQFASGDSETERLAREIIAAAIEVHRELGPGLLPSAYHACLCHELHLRRVPLECKRTLPLTYKGVQLGDTDEVEMLVGSRVVVKPTSLTDMKPVHHADLLSQLRLGGWKLGLLINFNTVKLADGLRRVVRSQAGASMTAA